MANNRWLLARSPSQTWISVGQPWLHAGHEVLSITNSRLGFDLNKHRELWEFALQTNWDGDSARAVTSDVVELAQRLIDEYTLMNPIETVPGTDGSLSFVWQNNGNYCYLEVGPGKTVHLYYDNTSGKWEGVFLEGDAELSKRLRNAFSSLREPIRAIAFKTLSSSSQMRIFSEEITPQRTSTFDAATANSNMPSALKQFSAA